MTDPLGFVVLARRPNPNGGHTVEPVSAVFNGPKALEQAQNVRESRRAGNDHPDPCQGYFCQVCFPDDWPGTHQNPPRPKPAVEYVIGEIGEWGGR